MPREVDPGTIKKGSGYANQDSVDSNSFTNEVIEGQTHGLDAHIHDAQGAHPASSISTTGSGGIYYGDDVQENLDELSALVPPKPPTLGNFSTIVGFTGITDWGILKLRDAGFVARGDATAPVPADPNDAYWTYQEWLYPPFEAQSQFSTFLGGSNPRGVVFTVEGDDPDTDPTFNVANGGYPGGGSGTTHEGGFIRTTPIIETARVVATASTDTVISGSVYPADRGVIGLFHWPAGGDVAAFLAQGLTDRVIAAILCGQGANGDCDGDPGGMFSPGDPDAFAFPGAAAGQYDLVELHLGVDGQTGDPIPGGPDPGAGQVRLGTDPNAGPVVAGGIPILGGTTAGTGGGNDNNFFRYRLPYLDDYSSATGIKYTPDVQKPRYFQKPAVSLNPGTDLTEAGDYSAFAKDYWTFQVARYRHTFAQPVTQDKGAYIFLHFKREADFEAFARDGIMPDDISFGYELWSAGLVNYINPESVDNLTDNTTDPGNPQTSTAYHVHRSAIFEDPDTGPGTLGLSYTFAREVDEVMFVSGVQYFLPNGSGVGTNWQIDTLTWSASGAWADAFRLGANHGLPDITPGLENMWPGILYMGMATAASNIINGLGPGYTGFANYQRVEFDYVDMDSVSGPWDLTTGPTPLDSADVVLTGGDTPITFAGDDGQCHFWRDARLRFFLRKPLDQQSPAPSSSTEFLFPNPGGDMLLIHTTSQSPSTASAGIYGNFKTTDPGDFPPRASLETARKDVEERFLDEVYRVTDVNLSAIDPTFNIGLGVGNLTGPGLPFPAAPIDLPVRIADDALAGFGAASWLRQDYHLLDLAAAAPVATEAQVAGVPDRNPPVTDGVADPTPLSGLLMYPQGDYTVGFRPSTGAGDTTNPQFDYSGIADPERLYIRIFDAAYSNEAAAADREPGVVGQAFLDFRIDGLELADFAYAAPGPGSPEIAVEVKVPGLTTWMDMGRTDMSGPSKQDPLADGAGCKVIDPNYTYDGRDAVTGTVYARVRINVGPVATLFANGGLVVGAPAGVAPVVVRVRIKAAGAAFNLTQGGPDTPTDIVRGLTGVTVLRHSDGLGPNDAAPYGPPFSVP